MPSSRSGRPDLGWLTARPYAHRGLHGGGIVENSRAAFEAAIERGHGIELDVRASQDGVPFVFHDRRLDRLTERSGRVVEVGSQELERIQLAGTGETIPRLEAVLSLIGGRVPLLIEMKTEWREAWRPLCRSVALALRGYGGPVAVMSFDPRVGAWLARHCPTIVRGLVVSEQERKGVRGRIQRELSALRARPHLIACDVRDLPSRFAARQRKQGLPILAWTVRTEEDRARAAAHADQIIYETLFAP